MSYLYLVAVLNNWHSLQNLVSRSIFWKFLHYKLSPLWSSLDFCCPYLPDQFNLFRCPEFISLGNKLGPNGALQVFKFISFFHLIWPWPWCHLCSLQSPLKQNLGPLKYSFIWATKILLLSFGFTKHPPLKIVWKRLGPIGALQAWKLSYKDTLLAKEKEEIKNIQIAFHSTRFSSL